MTTVVVPAMYAGTPATTTLDARGLLLRELQCFREAADDALDLRITRHSHGPRGQLKQSVDPRLASTSPNFRWQHDLAGQPLRTDSVDAGVTLALTDVAGRSLLAISATGVRQTSTYEDSTLTGRLQAVLEQAPGEAAPRVTDRFCWAGQSQAEKDLNLRGQCVRHYDTAGLNQLQRASVNGAVLAQSRQLLAGEQAADWAGDSEQGWQAALDAEAFITQRTVDATGALLTQTDACGHVQRQAYHLTGQLRGSWLTLQGQAEQVIVASLRYSAMGQKVQEVHGNGVITDYDYEPRTQHLIGIRVQRPAKARSAARVLQDLRYTYDPVGNLLNVRNDAEATRFWRNQKVVPEQAFAYDSLYQLVQATGREMANRGQQDSQLPAVLIPIPTHDDAYTPYTRTYRYDRAGNLTHIQHSAPASYNNYTTQLTVSNRSNRAVLAQDGLLPEDIDEQFDDGGHQLALLPGQHLRWNTRGELAHVTPILREGQPDDREWYRYGSDAMRVLKVSQQQAAGISHEQRVLYLEGLEVRSTFVGETLSERLEVIAVAAAARVLHWVCGQPPAVNNDQVRYSYHDPIGSSGLELDARGEIISLEEYFPYGGTAVWTARNQVEADYKAQRYSGKERDATGLHYYGYRYLSWVGRWMSADPAGSADGLNLFRMVKNNPLTLRDADGLVSEAYLYAPVFSKDVVVQVAASNMVRFYNKKSFMPVIVNDESARDSLSELIQSKISEFTALLNDLDVELKARSVESPGDYLGREAAAQAFSSYNYLFEFNHALRNTEIVTLDHGLKLKATGAENRIVKVVGHGSPGSDYVAAKIDAVHEHDKVSAKDIVSRLKVGGWLDKIHHLRLLSCFSAGAQLPSSFDRSALEESSKAIVVHQFDGAGMYLESRVVKSLAENVYDGVKNDYPSIAVAGYQGELLTSGGEYNVNRLGGRGGMTIRRKFVRQVFSSAKS